MPSKEETKCWLESDRVVRHAGNAKPNSDSTAREMLFDHIIGECIQQRREGCFHIRDRSRVLVLLHACITTTWVVRTCLPFYQPSSQLYSCLLKYLQISTNSRALLKILLALIIQQSISDGDWSNKPPPADFISARTTSAVEMEEKTCCRVSSRATFLSPHLSCIASSGSRLHRPWVRCGVWPHFSLWVCRNHVLLGMSWDG